MKPNDLIDIGSGPVGQRDAIQGATTGKRVAVIEKHSAIGGVSIHTSTTARKTVPLHRFARDSRTRFAPNSSPRIELPLEAPGHIEAADSQER